MGELSCNWSGMNGFKVKTENDFFIVICSRCRQNLKSGDFTLLFCGVRQRNAKKRLNSLKQRRRLRQRHRHKARTSLVQNSKNTRAARAARIFAHFFAVLHKTRGSLRNDDGYGNDNAKKQ